LNPEPTAKLLEFRLQPANVSVREFCRQPCRCLKAELQRSHAADRGINEYRLGGKRYFIPEKRTRPKGCGIPFGLAGGKLGWERGWDEARLLGPVGTSFTRLIVIHRSECPRISCCFEFPRRRVGRRRGSEGIMHRLCQGGHESRRRAGERPQVAVK